MAKTAFCNTILQILSIKRTQDISDPPRNVHVKRLINDSVLRFLFFLHCCLSFPETIKAQDKRSFARFYQLDSTTISHWLPDLFYVKTFLHVYHKVLNFQFDLIRKFLSRPKLLLNVSKHFAPSVPAAFPKNLIYESVNMAFILHRCKVSHKTYWHYKYGRCISEAVNFRRTHYTFAGVLDECSILGSISGGSMYYPAQWYVQKRSILKIRLPSGRHEHSAHLERCFQSAPWTLTTLTSCENILYGSNSDFYLWRPHLSPIRFLSPRKMRDILLPPHAAHSGVFAVLFVPHTCEEALSSLLMFFPSRAVLTFELNALFRHFHLLRKTLRETVS